MVNKRKAYARVLESAFHTSMAFVTMSVIMTIAVAVSLRFGAGAIVFRGLGLIAGIGFFTFLSSEVIIQIVFKATRANPDEYPEFFRAVDKLCKRCWYLPTWIVRPRLYILNMGEVPNAAAFGCGLFWQYGVGITKPLYELLSTEELEAVIAHEIAHIRCKDVGVMTTLSLVLSGAENIAQIFLGGKTALGKGPAALLLGLFFLFLAKFIFPIGMSAIAQQREYAADALAALYVRSADPLSSALLKLSDSAGNQSKRTSLDEIFLTHPRVEKRIEALRGLSPKPTSVQ